VNPTRLIVWLAAAVVAAVALGVASVFLMQRPRVVLYCAQDKEFAEGVLGDFTKANGLEVTTKFDTEADKSVSLVHELLKEGDHPRCDVFWNNEIVSTIRLQKKGLLAPYASPSAEPYPERAKAKDDTWHAFAERARVLIVNTKLVEKEEDRPKSLLDLQDKRWKGKAAMARPQFGTSATQAACLFAVLGADRAKEYYHALRLNGVQIAPGNKQVAEWVGNGRTPAGAEVAVGVTDTDDAMDEVAAGHPVAIIFPDRDADPDSRMGTLFIPNTVAVVKNCPNPEGAKKLVDFLLSADVEKRLAESDSHQIPINPKVKAELPKEVEAGRTARRMAVDFDNAADLWDEAQKCVIAEFAQP
jgi:iron(III) transport system substrate-binding protein